jgi:hypothetical protein
MMRTGYPAGNPLKTITETAVRNGTVFPQIQIPAEYVGIEFALFNSFQEDIIVILTLAPADYFTIALWRK